MILIERNREFFPPGTLPEWSHRNYQQRELACNRLSGEPC